MHSPWQLKMLLIKCHLWNRHATSYATPPPVAKLHPRSDEAGVSTLKIMPLANSCSLNLNHREQLQNVSGQSIQIILASEFKAQHIHGVDRKCNEMTSCPKEKEWKLICFSESVLRRKNVRGNSSMEIKHVPGVTYLNMQGKYFFPFFLSVFSSIASGTKCC